MRKLALSILVILAGGLVAAGFYTEQPTEDGKALAAVKVIVEGGHGSGVQIRPDYIITAAHVVDSDKDGIVDIKLSDGTIHKGTVLWYNSAYDIAAISSDIDEVAQISRLERKSPSHGDDIHITGNPFVAETVTVWGRISGFSVHEIGPWKMGMEINAAVVMGQSGGPVYNSRGEVVGIVVGVMTIPLGLGGSLTGIGIMVPSEAIAILTGMA